MSIKKIAEKAGTSPATVSRVLNNPGYRCSEPGLRERIWQAAMEMDYVPNEAARNLKKGETYRKQTFFINVLMTRMGQEQSDPFFTELLKVIESEIHKNNCILSRVWYNPLFSDDRKCRKENMDRIIAEMLEDAEGKSDGLVVIGKCNKEALKKLNKKYKGVVSVNRNSTNYEVDEVLCDGKKISKLAVEHLISLGHRKIGYVGECQNEARYQGYLETLLKWNIDVNPNYVFESKQTEIKGFETMQNLMASEERPTGLYCANDITAIGVLKCISQYKNRRYVPAVISSDDIEEAENTKPMLTTVRLPKEEMGKFAMLLLIDRLQGGHNSVVRTELEGKLMIRNSCKSVEDGDWVDYYI